MPLPRLIRALQELQGKEAAQHQETAARIIDPELAALRRWQSERLARTYADLSADPQYAAACAFFLDDIYAPHDFSRRDADGERLHGLLSEYLPESMLRLLADTLKLNRFTAQLDRQLLEALEPGDAITPESYAAAYRRCDNLAQRGEQIDLLAAVLSEAAHGGRSALVGISLRLARIPAERAGWNDLYGFLERGYLACKPMRDVDFFVDTIRRREIAVLENIFAGRDTPFDVE